MKSKLKLTEEEVKHIAKLANLPISAETIVKLKTDLSNILDLVNQLQKIDSQNVEPTNQVTKQENVFREDKVEKSLSQEEALSGATKKHNGYFQVGAVLEE